MKNWQLIALLALALAGVSWASEKDPVARNCGRFSNIVFVSIDVKNEPIQDALDFINQNWLETDPHVKGFDFKIAKKGMFRAKRLTIKGKNLKVYELAGMIAAQLDAKITIGPDAIEFSPRKRNQPGEQDAGGKREVAPPDSLRSGTVDPALPQL